MTTIIDDDSTTEDHEFVFCQYGDEVEITNDIVLGMLAGSDMYDDAEALVSKNKTPTEILKNFGYSIVFSDVEKEWSSY